MRAAAYRRWASRRCGPKFTRQFCNRVSASNAGNRGHLFPGEAPLLDPVNGTVVGPQESALEAEGGRSNRPATTNIINEIGLLKSAENSKGRI